MRRVKHLAVVVGLSITVGLAVAGCAARKEAAKTATTAEDEAKRRAMEADEAKRKAEEEARRRVEAEKAAANEAKRKAEEEARRRMVEDPAAQRKAELTLDAIHFDFDKYNLRPDAQSMLAKYATVLQKYPEVEAVIEGHCDERGTVEYNLALGERRAKSAYDYFVRYGIDKKRMKTVSYGEEQPVDPGHNEDAWWKNRRDEFIMADPMAGR
ncbi:MAG: peptidoglycan-associated lipoprotein Pal [Candidatus Latescibacteria bacterium]|nr:peptidoglycan-associated lipoprotein Pal [Candidatus Latescibacterota bacterium]